MPVVPVIHYLLNKDYIAKNLCVNRDKPKSCCKGKCHMIKQLQKANQNPEKNTKNTGNRLQLKNLNEFLMGFINQCISPVFSIKLLTNNNLTHFRSVSADIYVPPKTLL